MKSPAMHWFHHAVCFLSALGAIHVGLMAWGYNILAMPFLAGWAKPIEYIFGVAGVISLVFLFMHTLCGCGGCGCGSSCTCDR